MYKNLIQFRTLENEFSDKKNNRKTKIKSWLLLPAFLLLFPILAAAQAVSGVTGVVTDPNGALVPGVEVKLTDTKTGREQTTKANDDGSYTFNNVAPGSGYKLTFSTTGFQTLVITDVQLGIGKTETHNAQLVTGDVSGIVTVTTTTGDATLNTSDSSIGNVIGERQLRELPIRLRGSPASLLSLQPGVVGNNVGISTNSNVDAKTDNRIGSSTGSRADQQNITVDGIDANDQAGGFAFSTVAGAPIDSVQEFRSVTANPNANEGRSAGAQIQIATKSGTNDFHGSLREYYRTEQTAANSFFNNRNGVARPGLRRHQYGGSLGGPLPFFNFGEDNDGLFNSGKDKLFFFFDYEQRRDRSQSTTTRIVPLQSFREGRIGYINRNAGCTAASRRDTTPGCISELTTAQAAALDPRGIGVNSALLSFINSRYPVANDFTGGDGINTGLFRFNAPVIQNSKVYTTRIDGNITSNQKVFGRLTISPTNSTQNLQQFPGDSDSQSFIDRSYGVAFGHSWVISPSLFNQVTAGLTKQFNDFSANSSPDQGLINYASAQAAPYGTFGTLLTSPFVNLSEQQRTVYTPTFRDDATWTKGTHTFQFGASYKPIRYKPSLSSDFSRPTIGLGGNITALAPALRPSNIGTGTTATTLFDTAYSFILGRYAAVSTNFQYDPQGNVLPSGSGRNRSYAYNEYEYYAQDNWKIRNDLTLNLGLRYVYYPAPYEVNGFQTAPNIDFNQLFNTRVQNAANGVAGVSAEPLVSYSLSGKANNAKPYYSTDKNNFAPRIGFAYNPSFKEGFLGKVFGDRKTSIRGGAGMVYDRISGTMTFILDQNTYIFDTSNTRNFGVSGNPVTSLLNDPRFASIGTIPTPPAAPQVSNPFTPFVTDGVGIGLALGTANNYAVDRNFKTPYEYQFSVGIQRELPGNFLLDVSYVGRIGRQGFTQGDTSQTLNFKDPASGQFLFDAFNAVQAQLQTGANISPQPWIENQVGLARASTNPNYCATRAQGSCTALIAANFGDLLAIGDSSDTIQALYAANLLRPNVGVSSQLASNQLVNNLGKSNYNGMLISLQKRFSKGFEFDVNYSWSHALDNNSSVVNTGTANPLVFDLLDPQRGYSNSDFDIRHLFNANGDWDLPIGRGRLIGGNMSKWLDTFVGGWTVSGIVTARSGLVFNPTSGSFPVSFIVNSPAIVNGPLSAFKTNIHDEGGGIQYFADPAAAQAALRYPRHGEVGGRNSLRGPSFWNADALVSKKFKMPWSETQRLTIRAEAYNLFNNVQFNLPSLVYDTTTFGRIGSTTNAAREFQFAIRYDF